MASVILAGTTSTTALNLTGDTSGELQLKTNNGSTTALTLTTGGNINIPTTGARITGDYNNGTLVNRVYFQNINSNVNTSLGALPNGTGNTSQFIFYNNSDPTNAGRTRILATNAESALISDISGTGSYLPLTMYTGGSERLRIDTSGNVGIGTSSPSATLDVRNTSNEQIRFGYTGTPNYCSLGRNSGTGNFNIFVNSAEPLLFGTNNTERMRITSAGDVLINATSNSFYANSPKLTVVGGASPLVISNGDNSGTFLRFDTGADNGIITINANARSGNYPPLAFQTADTERMRIDSSGRLLVGTTSGARNFVLGGGSGNSIMSFNNDSTGYAAGDGFQIQLSSTNASIWTYENDYIRFGTNDTERGRFTAGGYFKASNTGTYENATGTYHEFLTDKNDSIIEFENTATSGNVYGAQIELGGQTPNNTTSKFLSCGDTTNEKCVIYSSGTITNRTGTYNSFSDLKLKQDVVDASSQWDDIKAVRVRKFRLKDDVAANPDAKTMIGVIAQELEQTSAGLIDDCVDKDGEVTKAVKYSILYMKAIKALQEAMERIEKLETEVAKLKGV